MGQKYRVDRLFLISYRGKPKKAVRDMKCRYIAKSRFINCSGINKCFEYVNFRGSHFKNVDFSDSVFYGCDFWGASFNKCKFRNARISHSTFVGCRFKETEFENCNIRDSVIVNTNLVECYNLSLRDSVEVLLRYPIVENNAFLDKAVDMLRSNHYIRKHKLLHLPGNRTNTLNIYLLKKLYSDEELADLLLQLNCCTATFTKGITTYKKLEKALKTMNKMV